MGHYERIEEDFLLHLQVFNAANLYFFTALPV